MEEVVMVVPEAADMVVTPPQTGQAEEDGAVMAQALILATGHKAEALVMALNETG